MANKSGDEPDDTAPSGIAGGTGAQPHHGAGGSHAAPKADASLPNRKTHHRP